MRETADGLCAKRCIPAAAAAIQRTSSSAAAGVINEYLIGGRGLVLVHKSETALNNELQASEHRTNGYSCRPAAAAVITAVLTPSHVNISRLRTKVLRTSQEYHPYNLYWLVIVQ